MRIAISTCPNDTFAFHAILENKIDRRGLELSIELLDIQELNEGLFSGRFDVAKASFHAALRLTDSTWVLPSGSALGFGVGPLLLAANPNQRPGTVSGTTTYCPGQHTTATMLYHLFYSEAINANATDIRHVVFSEIMPSLKSGEADFGVCIHEGRFTWENEGLYLVEDLGTRWGSETGLPLPLGGILASRELANDKILAIQQLIRASILYAQANRKETIATMKKYAQEFETDVLFQHVDLYVNPWTVVLGEKGKAALDELFKQGRQTGLVDKNSRPIQIWQPE